MATEQETVWVAFDERVTVTDSAVLFDFDGEQVWIPRSQIFDEDEADSSIEIPQWLAEDRGLA